MKYNIAATTKNTTRQLSNVSSLKVHGFYFVITPQKTCQHIAEGYAQSWQDTNSKARSLARLWSCPLSPIKSGVQRFNSIGFNPHKKQAGFSCSRLLVWNSKPLGRRDSFIIARKGRSGFPGFPRNGLVFDLVTGLRRGHKTNVNKKNTLPNANWEEKLSSVIASGMNELTEIANSYKGSLPICVFLRGIVIKLFLGHCLNAFNTLFILLNHLKQTTDIQLIQIYFNELFNS